MYQYLIKPFLFLLNPERAHHLTILLLRIVLNIPGGKWVFRKLYQVEDPKLQRTVLGLTFPNPVGLAAGFDKDGKYYNQMSALGFGFIEIGTVTPIAQAGNDKPRLFRIPQDDALINRMGFNNDGVAALVENLKKRQASPLIIGGNIGKNKITPNENATDDYVKCFEALYEYVDYFVVNVSSPNTPGLRELQEKAPLTALLSTLKQKNTTKPKRKPILLKIAPDLTDTQLDDIIDIVTETKIDGIIATNTTLDRSKLTVATEHIGMGGLSGKPLKKRSTEVIRYIYQKSKGSFTIIGVGGIENTKDAQEKLDAGASLVQVYSGLVYQGPGLIKRILKGLNVSNH
ncbi:MAG: quinone-dependent dihydroorotate dehydrogenase [Saprospiraceae bacterium]|nr:quinone-dependent dihydroorotate dehydrogenase [Saprospiraceae bacterium]